MRIALTRSLGHRDNKMLHVQSARLTIPEKKLEAIPGLTTLIDTEAVSKQLWDDDLGFAIFAPTAEIAPVDKAIYALRDVVRQPKKKSRKGNE